MCFSQDKACVYEPEEDLGTIVTEWPNGVIDRHNLETKTRVRHWPDGTTETVTRMSRSSTRCGRHGGANSRPPGTARTQRWLRSPSRRHGARSNW